MKRVIGVLGLSLALSLGLGACVKTGDVTERVPVTQDLATYKTASVQVDMPVGVKNGESEKVHFVTLIGDKLRDKKVFSDIVAGGGELTLKVKVTSVEGGNKLALAMGPAAGGESQVAASVDLFDTKQGKSVGAFDVTGNSKKNTQTSVGGVNTSAMEDTTSRALEAAAEEIAGYLAKRRAGAK